MDRQTDRQTDRQIKSTHTHTHTHIYIQYYREREKRGEGGRGREVRSLHVLSTRLHIDIMLQILNDPTQWYTDMNGVSIWPRLLLVTCMTGLPVIGLIWPFCDTRVNRAKGK